MCRETILCLSRWSDTVFNNVVDSSQRCLLASNRPSFFVHKFCPLFWLPIIYWKYLIRLIIEIPDNGQLRNWLFTDSWIGTRRLKTLTNRLKSKNFVHFVYKFCPLFVIDHMKEPEKEEMTQFRMEGNWIMERLDPGTAAQGKWVYIWHLGIWLMQAFNQIQQNPSPICWDNFHTILDTTRGTYPTIKWNIFGLSPFSWFSENFVIFMSFTE